MSLLSTIDHFSFSWKSNSTAKSASIRGSTVGPINMNCERHDLLIIDDVVNDKKASSEETGKNLRVLGS